MTADATEPDAAHRLRRQAQLNQLAAILHDNFGQRITAALANGILAEFDRQLVALQAAPKPDQSTSPIGGV